jgi:hypothetical protein
MTLQEKFQMISEWDQSKAPFPWSADIPLAESGLCLNIWGGLDPTFKKTGGNNIDDCDREPPIPPENFNTVLEVPPGWVLLWRGDLVHGGALQNPKKNGALRCHWYIPMKPADIGTIHGLVTGRNARVSRSENLSEALGLDMPEPHTKLENVFMGELSYEEALDATVSLGSKRQNPNWMRKRDELKKTRRDMMAEAPRRFPN